MDQQSIEKRMKNLVKLRKELRDIIDKETKIIEKERIELGLNIEVTKPKDIITKPKVKNVVKEVQAPVINKEEYIKLKNDKSDKEFFDNIKPMLDKIPSSNGSRFYSTLDVNIGIIADEFLYNSYRGIANFIYITPDNYKEHEDIDILFIASAWRGLNEEWKGMANPTSIKRKKLYEVMNFYKDKNKKVVFYSKEDPVNYDRFIDIAKISDYIFTTCKEITHKYKEECNNSNVDVLNFGINPIYHNPIGFRKFEKIDKVIFSGSWYNKYPHRIDDMNMILDGVVESKLGLKIIDRNYELDLEQHYFPKRYMESVSPSVSHEYLQKVHKLFNWAINFNSIKDSYTMFANRIYELQATGNSLISNYSVGVNNSFPNVFLINDKKEVKNIIDNMTDEETYEHQVLGIRRVMTNETSNERISQMLSKIGIENKEISRKVLVIVEKKTESIIKMFNSQSFDEKIIIEKRKVTQAIWNDCSFVTFFDDDKYYGRYYLQDMVNAFKYTNCDYITKDAYYNKDALNKGVEHDYVNIMKNKSRTVFWTKKYKVKALLQMKNNISLKNGYSIDRFEFNNSKNYVTCKKKIETDAKFSLIIPTYNNGDHLANKCFNSLRRSSMFNEMEVIIVDDGSTDNYTKQIVEYIGRKYENVKVYTFDDGGSGSASRPRNKGVELSTTNYIAFLDPDNEAVNDGYTKLYNEIINKENDMIVGNMLKIDSQSILLNYYKTMMLYNKCDTLSENKKQFLIDTKFKGMSIQALMVKKSIIKENNLSQVLGAVGQDTLFFYQLLLNSSIVKTINETIHIYYAAVEGSTVNDISKKYFNKAFKIEEAKYNFFKQNDLLENYLSNRYGFYYKNWYIKKLEKVKIDEKEECIELVKDLYRIYQKDIKKVDNDIKEFINS